MTAREAAAARLALALEMQKKTYQGPPLLLYFLLRFFLARVIVFLLVLKKLLVSLKGRAT